MTALSRRLVELPDSATLAMKARATALAAAGRRVVDLSAGEPDFAPPQGAMAAAHAAIDAGANTYAPVNGVPALRAAVASLYTQHHGLAVTAEQVLVTHGGKQALYMLMQALLDPGDEAVVPTPAWVSYLPQIALAGARAVCVPCDPRDGFQPDPDRVAAAFTPRTRLVILNSPSNPTGCVVAPDRLRAIDAAAAKRGIVVISDELYRSITFDGVQAICHATLADPALTRTVLVDAVSKTWAMTGWRVGFLLGPRDLVAALGRLQGHLTSGVCRVSQAAALQAITGPQDFLPPVVVELGRRRDRLVAGLAALDGIDLDVVPEGAFYVFPRVDGLFGRQTPAGLQLRCGEDVAAALLDLGGVAVVPGEGFEEPRCVRLSYATSMEEVDAGLRGLAAALAQLR